METMNYREKKKKSLKLPIFGLSTFLIAGACVITYGMMNEKEPVIVGNNGSRIAGTDVPVVETSALVQLKEEDLDKMFDVKTQYDSDKSLENIKSDLSIPFVFINGEELKEFNSELEEKYKKQFEGFKETMSSVEHSFTYRVYYQVFSSVVRNEGIISIIVTEKMVDDENQEESLKKRTTYNISIDTKEVLDQRDVIISILGASYKDAIKESLSSYLEENEILSKEDYKYAYTGFENFYIKKGKLHFIFNSRRFS